MQPKNKKNNHEVEVRALLKDKDKKSILKKLLEHGGVSVGEEVLEDSYWCPEDTKSFEGVEMNGVGSYSLRLRKSGNGALQLNVKVITKKGDHNAWDEHEVTIDSHEEASRILGALGFKEFFTLKKIRHSFRTGEFTVLVEDIKGFGPIIEVEILTNKERATEAKKKITNFLLKLGVDPSRIVPKSVTNLLMKEKSRF